MPFTDDADGNPNPVSIHKRRVTGSASEQLSAIGRSCSFRWVWRKMNCGTWKPTNDGNWFEGAGWSFHWGEDLKLEEGFELHQWFSGSQMVGRKRHGHEPFKVPSVG